MTNRCVILGGGGHAKVLIDCIRASKAAEMAGILDANASLHGQTVLDVPVLGGDDLLPELAREKGVTHFVVGLGAAGDNRPRRKLFELGQANGLTPLTVIHPSAVCSGAAEVGSGSMICPAAVVNAGTKIGRNVIVNSGAIVEHDCVLEDHVHVAPGARLSGSVRIGSMAHIGVGATVLQGLTIGELARVGGGALVTKNVAPRKIVAKVPAVILKNDIDDTQYASGWDSEDPIS